MESTLLMCSYCGIREATFNLVCVDEIDGENSKYISYMLQVCKECLVLSDCYCDIHDTSHTVMRQPKGYYPTHTCSLCVSSSIEKMTDAHVEELFSLLKTVQPGYIQKIFGMELATPENIKDKRTTLTNLALLASLQTLTLEEAISYLVTGRFDSTLQ